MQLFITDYEKEGEKLFIKEKRVVYQLKNVLRAKFGYNFFVQDLINSPNKIRYKLELLEYQGNKCVCRKLSESNKVLENDNFGMLIAILNKSSKHDLLVQKLVEIGVPHICFFDAERSVSKSISLNKIERLQKIALEAAEQSMGWTLAKIEFVEFIDEFVKDKEFIVFDYDGENSNNFNKLKIGKNTYGIVGPEGGLTNRDLEKMSNNVVYKVSLGKTNLRAETAAILGGWLLNRVKHLDV